MLKSHRAGVCVRWTLSLVGCLASCFGANLAQAAPVSPVTSGLVYWVDANDLDGDGIAEGAGESGLASGSVASWADKAAGYVGGDASQTATQATSASRPLFVTSGLNSRPVVRFDGNDDIMQSPAFAAPLAQATEVFAVWKADSTSGDASVLMDGLSGSNRQAIVYEPVPGNSIGLYAGNGVVASYYATPFTDPIYMSAIFNDPDNSVAAPNGSFRINGVTVNTTANHGSQSLDGVTLGARFAPSGPLTYVLDGYIAELLIYNTPLSTTDRDAVEAYLQYKWFDAESTLPPAPEPGTGMLLLLGGMLFAKRRRKV